MVLCTMDIRGDKMAKLTREELEAIKPGDRIKYRTDFLDFRLTGVEYIIAIVDETRVRCGANGDVFEDYVITVDKDEVDYEDILEVNPHE